MTIIDNMEQKDEILTLNELASYLKVSEKTIMRLINRGEVPCFKVANQWRFNKKQIEKWLNNQDINRTPDTLTNLFEDKSTLFPLSRLTAPEFIILNITPGSVNHILSQLVNPLLHNGIIQKKEEFIQRLENRENLLSTCISNGIALPHARYPEQNEKTKPVVVVGICKEGTIFDISNKDRVFIFFLIHTNSTIVHLRALSSVNTLIKNQSFVKDLMTARNKEEIIKLIIQHEQKHTF